MRIFYKVAAVITGLGALIYIVLAYFIISTEEIVLKDGLGRYVYKSPFPISIVARNYPGIGLFLLDNVLIILIIISAIYLNKKSNA